MMLFGKPMWAIEKADILRLLENKVQESMTLDYKQELLGANDEAKKEFLCDISSFANEQGGVMLFGIEEEKDKDGRNTGIPKRVCGLPGTNIDQAQSRLLNIIQDGLDPKLYGVTLRSLTISESTILLLGIPRSLSSPHIVWFKKSGKFFRRNSAGSKYQMDVYQIRGAFLESESWEKRADNFRRERIISVRSLEVIPNLDIVGSYFVHIVPLGSGDSRRLDIVRHEELLRMNFPPPVASGWNTRYNLDGFMTIDGLDPVHSYVQFFRNGSVEIYTSWAAIQTKEGAPLHLNAMRAASIAKTYVDKFLSYSSELQIEPPYAVFLSLMDLKGGTITREQQSFLAPWEVHTFDRNEILLPAILIEGSQVDVSNQIQSAFDIVYQAYGWKEAPRPPIAVVNG
jgi:hypothetical protein